MKKARFLSIVCALVMLFSISTSVFAGTEAETLPDPGITPDSPFYFMDKWGKQIAMAFTFGAENKVQKALRYADERLAEMRDMVAQNKLQEATQAGNEYQYCLQIAAQKMEQAKSIGTNTAEKMALMLEKHLQITNRVSANLAQEAQKVMTQTREKAVTCQETALKKMAQGDPEQAVRLNLQLMERQLTRMQLQSDAPETSGLQTRMQEYTRLGNLGQKISETARGSGKEAVVDQLICQATEQHLEVLTQLQQRVQGEAQAAVEDALENCTQIHERLANQLQAQNQLGPIPEEVSSQSSYQSGLEQSTQTMTQTGAQTQAGQGPSGTATQTETQTQNQTGQGTQTNQDMPNASESDSTGTTSAQGSGSGGSQRGR